ncbi:MAG: beta-N-acetylhexosaminidase [Phocaeicola sp.]
MNCTVIKKMIALVSIFLCFVSGAMARTILPTPRSMRQLPGSFVFMKGETLELFVEDAQFTGAANLLVELLPEAVEAKVVMKKSVDKMSKTKRYLLFEADDSLQQEEYILRVTPERIVVRAAAKAGAFHAVQSLLQLFPIGEEVGEMIDLPCVVIEDAPRFGYRGAHLDVSRHFFRVAEVKTFIDMLAMHKLNYFHWHLTDDQGWRIEIKRYPRLTEVGSIRSETVVGYGNNKFDGVPYGGYYTQADIREIVAYATSRNVEVIPEIDLPGHMNAALAAYPELGCQGKNYAVRTRWGVSEDVLCGGNEATLQFVKEVLSEVIPLFPSAYFHLGGDECPKDRWRACEKCQQKIKSLGLAVNDSISPENRLQSYFMGELEQFLHRNGKVMIGWDEMLENGLSSTSSVLMAWRSESYAYEAAKGGNRVILTPSKYFYLNYYQTFEMASEPPALLGTVPMERTYGFEPLCESLTQAQAANIWGVQASHWSEHINSFSLLQYQSLPRLAAAAEVGWSSAPKNYPLFCEKLIRLMSFYSAKGYNFGKHLFDVKGEIVRSADFKSQAVVLSTFDKAVIRYTTDGSEVTANSLLYEAPLVANDITTIKAKAFRYKNESRTWEKNFRYNPLSLCEIELLTPCYKDYCYSGAALLNDGLFGDMNYSSGVWLGYHGNDLEFEVKLNLPTEASKLWVNCLVANPDWIFRPETIEVYHLNEAGERLLLVHKEFELEDSMTRQIERLEVEFPSQLLSHLVVRIVPRRVIPNWHPAKGGSAFLFVDEAGIE